MRSGSRASLFRDFKNVGHSLVALWFGMFRRLEREGFRSHLAMERNVARCFHSGKLATVTLPRK